MNLKLRIKDSKSLILTATAAILMLFQNCAAPLEEIQDPSATGTNTGASNDNSASNTGTGSNLPPTLPPTDPIPPAPDPEPDPQPDPDPDPDPQPDPDPDPDPEPDPEPDPDPFQVLSPPSDANLTEGDSTVLSILVTGGNVVGFQWFQADTPIPGAIATSYALNSVDLSSAGVYRVEVYGPGQTLLASRALLVTVVEDIDPVNLVSVSPAITINEEQSVDLVASATGTITEYRWFFEGTRISGASGATYRITDAALSDAGTYRVEVHGPETGSSPPSDTIEVTVNEIARPVTIASSSGNVNVIAGSTAPVLTVSTTGPVTAYRWYRNSTLLATNTTTSNSNSYTISSVTTANSGAYRVEVVGNIGQLAATASYSVTISPPPTANVSISAASHNYGNDRAINTNHDRQFTLTNSGNASASINNAGLAAPFSIVSNGCGSSIAANSSCNFSIRYRPTAYDTTSSDTLTITLGGVPNLAVSVTGNSESPPPPQYPIALAVSISSSVAPLGNTANINIPAVYTPVVTFTGSVTGGYGTATTYQWQRRQVAAAYANSVYTYSLTGSWLNVASATSTSYTLSVPNTLPLTGNTYIYRLRATRADGVVRYSNSFHPYWFEINIGL